MFGTVFQIQRFSLFDGPGVRTVVFLKGCPLKCVWCHNPEGIAPGKQILFDAEACIGCGDCVSACPNGCHVLRDGLHGFDRAACAGCGRCAEVCVTGALSAAGMQMDTETVIRQVLRDLPSFRESGGGMTLSGGEPLYQPEFALSLLRAAKEAGLSACVETCGLCPPEVLRQAAEYTDTFLYDYKATGEEAHRRLCGAGQGAILRNLSLLDELHADVVLRCPIVPGMNDSDAHLCGIARTAAEHPSVRLVQLEPYHRLGLSKSAQLGQTPAFEGRKPEPAVLEVWCAQIAQTSEKPCEISG